MGLRPSVSLIGVAPKVVGLNEPVVGVEVWEHLDAQKVIVWKEGKCDREKCKFEHARGTKSEANEGPKIKTCSRCGAKDHEMYSCTFMEDCSYCGKKGHKATFCRKKQAEDSKKGIRGGASDGPSPGPTRPTSTRPASGSERPASRQARFALEEAEQVKCTKI